MLGLIYLSNTGTFPKEFKSAFLKYFLKKQILDSNDLKNYYTLF